MTIRLSATPSELTSGVPTSTIPSFFYRPDALPAAQPTKALKATSAFGLGRRRYKSPQWCYLHCLHTTYYHYYYYYFPDWDRFPNDTFGIDKQV